MGKTRLALEIANAQMPKFEQGVYFIPLAPLRSPDSIIATIAESIGFRFYEGTNPKQQLFNYLCEKKLLLILDN
jgi:predicted ATPase